MSDNKQLILIRDSADDDSNILNALNRHNVSNEIVLDISVDIALEHLTSDDPAKKCDLKNCPHLIFVDVREGKKATTLVELLRSNIPTELIPIVAFVDVGCDELATKLCVAGANSVVYRTSDLETLGETILSAVMYWTLLNHNVA